ncbi:MAG: dockerin type I repeat-containing protein [Planctomycetota bacterium]
MLSSRKLFGVAGTVAAVSWLLAGPEAAAQNLVPNPTFDGTGGLALPLSGGTVNVLSAGVPNSWRAFAVAGSIDLDVIPLAADEVYDGSPEANSVLLRVNAYGADQGFDDDNGRTPLSPGVTYHAEFWVKSANEDGSDQTFNFGFPLFGTRGYLGIEPGGMSGVVAGAEWQLVVGPSFAAGPEVTNGHISWRCRPDGGEDAILIALPAILAENAVAYPTLLVCRREGQDVRLSWFNNAAYDALRVERDGSVLTEIPVDSTSYEDLDVPEGQHLYRVVATVGGVEDGPACEVAVYIVELGAKVSVDLGEVDLEEGLANSQREDGGDGENTFAICGPDEDLREARSNWGSEDPTPDFSDGLFYFNVIDPRMKAQSSYILEAVVYDDPARAGAGLYLQYTNADSAGPGDIPNTFFPIASPPTRTLEGTGAWVAYTWEIANAGFRSYQQGTSDFRLGVTDGGRLCIDRVELTYFPVIADLACRRRAKGVELSWKTSGGYDAIVVLRDGEEIASLAGDATAYLDEEAPSGDLTYQVAGEKDARRAGPKCSISVRVVPEGTKVSVDLGETDVEDGMVNSQREDGTDGETTFAICGPADDLREARSNWGAEDPTFEYPDPFFYFAVTDPDMKAQGSFRLVVTVYDDPARAGAGLYLQYTTQESTGPGDLAETFYPLAGAPANFLSGTDAWVELAWDIENAGFRSFQQGTSDFRLGVTDGGRLCVDKVELVFPAGGGGPVEPIFHRGDANGDGGLNITDGIFVLNYLFLGGPAPGCLEAANANDDADVNITDGIYVLNYLFLGGPAPPAPGPPEVPCGPDPATSPTALGCEVYTEC